MGGIGSGRKKADAPPPPPIVGQRTLTGFFPTSGSRAASVFQVSSVGREVRQPSVVVTKQVSVVDDDENDDVNDAPANAAANQPSTEEEDDNARDVSVRITGAKEPSVMMTGERPAKVSVRITGAKEPSVMMTGERPAKVAVVENPKPKPNISISTRKVPPESEPIHNTVFRFTKKDNSYSIIEDGRLLNTFSSAEACAPLASKKKQSAPTSIQIIQGDFVVNMNNTTAVSVSATAVPPARTVNIKSAMAPALPATASAEQTTTSTFTLEFDKAPLELVKAFAPQTENVAKEAVKKIVPPNQERKSREAYSMSDKLYFIVNQKLRGGGGAKVSKSCAFRWKQDADLIRALVAAGRGDLMKYRAPSKYATLYLTVHSRYISVRDRGEPVSTNRIAMWMSDLDADFKKISDSRKRANVIYFLTLYHLAIRVITGVPQVAPSDWKARILAFKRLFHIMFRKARYWKIAFGDETFANRHPLKKTTVVEKGIDHVTARFAGDKTGYTVWLAAIVELTENRPPYLEKKVPDLVVTMPPAHVLVSSKSKKKIDAKTEKRISGCSIHYTDSGWQTGQSMITWIHDYLPTCTAAHPGLMVWDLHASHRTPDVAAALKAKHWDQIFIPSGSTGDLQIMDTHVNHSFKELCRKHYEAEMDAKDREYQAQIAEVKARAPVAPTPAKSKPAPAKKQAPVKPGALVTTRSFGAAETTADPAAPLVIDDDSADDGEDEEVVDETGDTKTRKRIVISLSKVCARISSAWYKQESNIKSGFVHHLAPLLDEHPVMDDISDTMLKEFEEREMAERMVSAEYAKNKAQEAYQVYAVSDDEEEDVVERRATIDQMMTNLCLEDGDESEDVIARIESTSLAIDSKCCYCRNECGGGDMIISCTVCCVRFHQNCAEFVAKEQKDAVQKLCVACLGRKEAYKTICVYCKTGASEGKMLSRCGAPHCPIFLHLECGLARVGKGAVNNASLCSMHMKKAMESVKQ